MTNRSIAGLVFKVWGIIWIVSAASSVGSVTALLMASSPPGPENVMMHWTKMSYVFGTVSLLAAGIALSCFASRISRSLFPTEEPVHLDFSAAALQAALFAVLGIHFAIRALPGVVSIVYVLRTKPSWDAQSAASYAWDRKREAVLSSTVELIAGVTLFFSSNALSSLWRRLRPLSETPQPADPPKEAE